MPGFFPAPLEDELLYGLVARYGAIVGHRSGVALIGDAFGTRVGVAAVDLPRGLGRFVSRLPSGHGLDIDKLIQDHTLFPYLLRYAPPLSIEKVRFGMQENVGRRPARLGLMSAAFPVRERLMLCAACAREDAERCGYAAWRRVHQLPGVVICPKHGSPLAESGAERIHRSGRAALAVGNADVVAAAIEVKVPRGGRTALLKVALQSRRLLSDGLPNLGPSDVQVRLRLLLHDFHSARAPDVLDRAAIVEALRRHRPVRQVMEAAGAAFSDRTLDTALSRLFHGRGLATHPLLVLMLLEIAGASLDDLVISRISSTNVEPPRSSLHHEIIVRGSVPEPLVERNLEPDPRLAFLLADQRASVRAIGRELGISPQSVKRQARRLGLWREVWTDGPKVQLRRDAAAARLLTKHRKIWLSFREAHPGVTIRLMPKKPFNAYRYLTKNDPVWLAGNHPMRRRCGAAVVDWSERDLQLSRKAVRLLSEDRTHGSDAPRWSRSRIAKRIGAYSVVIRETSRLPMLTDIIRAHSEMATTLRP